MPVLCYHPDKHNTLPLTCRHLVFVGEITEYCIKGLVWFFCCSECCLPECSFSSLITSSKITILFSVPVYFVFVFVVFLLLSLLTLYFKGMAWHVSSFFFWNKIFPFGKRKDIIACITLAIKLLLSLVILKSWSLFWLWPVTSGASFRFGSDLTVTRFKLELSTSILSVWGI